MGLARESPSRRLACTCAALLLARRSVSVTAGTRIYPPDDHHQGPSPLVA